MAPQGIEAARLDHVGIVAGLCWEIGMADYLDARDTRTQERVSVGTATMAMVRERVGLRESSDVSALCTTAWCLWPCVCQIVCSGSHGLGTMRGFGEGREGPRWGSRGTQAGRGAHAL
jgi:hypothetical protein